MKFEIKPVSPGVYRSSQPITVEDFEAIKALGIYLVVDLEQQFEESPWRTIDETLFEASGVVTSRHVPLSGFWAPKKEDVEAILKLIDQADPARPILVHCLHGQDRTGLIVGLWRLRCGLQKWSSWGEMLANGFHPFLIGLSFFYWVRG